MDTEAQESTEEEGEFSLMASVKEAFFTIPENLAGLAGAVLDPLGIRIDVSDIDAAAEELEVEKTTFGSMVNLFGTKTAAFAYLLFVLLYFPCSAAIAAVYRETNLKWTLFAGFWTTFLAWCAATTFYQAATFHLHPVPSTAWIITVLAMFIGVVTLLHFIGTAQKRDPAAPVFEPDSAARVKI